MTFSRPRGLWSFVAVASVVKLGGKGQCKMWYKPAVMGMSHTSVVVPGISLPCNFISF